MDRKTEDKQSNYDPKHDHIETAKIFDSSEVFRPYQKMADPTMKQHCKVWKEGTMMFKILSKLVKR